MCARAHFVGFLSFSSSDHSSSSTYSQKPSKRAASVPVLSGARQQEENFPMLVQACRETFTKIEDIKNTGGKKKETNNKILIILLRIEMECLRRWLGAYTLNLNFPLFLVSCCCCVCRGLREASYKYFNHKIVFAWETYRHVDRTRSAAYRNVCAWFEGSPSERKCKVIHDGYGENIK